MSSLSNPGRAPKRLRVRSEAAEARQLRGGRLCESCPHSWTWGPVNDAVRLRSEAGLCPGWARGLAAPGLAQRASIDSTTPKEAPKECSKRV